LLDVVAVQAVRCPAVGVSRQPITFISVDLPEPGRPHDRQRIRCADVELDTAQRVDDLGAEHVFLRQRLDR
jgi:hypothetical protein